MPNHQTIKQQLKTRQLQKIFQTIDDEIAILPATAKYQHLIRKTDENHLKVTLAYIEDTTKLATVLKDRLTLLTEITS
ncbi:MAG TPA: hypothetical protein VLH35_03150 [Candidatus Acidoferrales bacterium]|nr:hypothetical protein [Candidatus Acidoferrales bacterium]